MLREFLCFSHESERIGLTTSKRRYRTFTEAKFSCKWKMWNKIRQLKATWKSKIPYEPLTRSIKAKLWTSNCCKVISSHSLLLHSKRNSLSRCSHRWDSSVLLEGNVGKVLGKAHASAKRVREQWIERQQSATEKGKIERKGKYDRKC